MYNIDMVNEKDIAPDFTLPDKDGNMVTLSSFRGKRAVVCFYPRDNTPGCTKEACSLRDALPRIEGENAVVIGISPDSAESHRRFQEKHSLPFLLLSDPDHRTMEAYGAYGEKMMYGKKSIGVIRSTFLISEEGVVLKVWRKVNTSTHGEDVSAYLRTLSS